MSKNELERYREVSGRSAVLAVLGRPVAHSLSPAIHNFWLRRYGIDAVYVALPLTASAQEAVAVIRALFQAGFYGLNITSPFKESAFAAADVADDNARAIGAANVLSRGGTSWRAANTDGAGFCAAWVEALRAAGRADLIGGRRAVILGAGGAGRAIAQGLVAAGVQCFIVNRSAPRAAEAAAMTGGVAIDIEDLQGIFASVDLIVNALPSSASEFAAEIPLAAAGRYAMIADLGYSPWESSFLERARALGLPTFNGFGMLLNQAALAFESWWGIRPDIDSVRHFLLTPDGRLAAPGPVDPGGDA